MLCFVKKRRGVDGRSLWVSYEDGKLPYKFNVHTSVDLMLHAAETAKSSKDSALTTVK